ncbi:hypothetical protein KKH13_03370 [Patescibacteria group bacterium]|nr:hypothetical protein [Patescibacteria group bacterium]
MGLGHDVLTLAPKAPFHSPLEGFNHASQEVLNGESKRFDLVTINTDFFNGRRDLFSFLKNISPDKLTTFPDNQIWEGLNLFLSGLSGEARPVEVLNQLIKEKKPERKELNYYQDELTWALPTRFGGLDWGVSVVMEDVKELSRSYFIAKAPKPKRSFSEAIFGFFRDGNPADF